MACNTPLKYINMVRSLLRVMNESIHPLLARNPNPDINRILQ